MGIPLLVTPINNHNNINRYTFIGTTLEITTNNKLNLLNNYLQPLTITIGVSLIVSYTTINKTKRESNNILKQQNVKQKLLRPYPSATILEQFQQATANRRVSRKSDYYAATYNDLQMLNNTINYLL